MSLVKVTEVLQTSTFKKAVKKLHKNQKQDLDKTVRILIREPLLGELKKRGLSFMRVYKFEMAKQLTLLGYYYEDGSFVLELLTFGSNENFYHNAKKIL